MARDQRAGRAERPSGERKNTTDERFVATLSILALVNLGIIALAAGPVVERIMDIMDLPLPLIFLGDVGFRLATAAARLPPPAVRLGRPAGRRPAAPVQGAAPVPRLARRPAHEPLRGAPSGPGIPAGPRRERPAGRAVPAHAGRRVRRHRRLPGRSRVARRQRHDRLRRGLVGLHHRHHDRVRRPLPGDERRAGVGAGGGGGGRPLRRADRLSGQRLPRPAAGRHRRRADGPGRPEIAPLLAEQRRAQAAVLRRLAAIERLLAAARPAGAGEPADPGPARGPDTGGT